MSNESKDRERLSALVDNLSRADDVKLNRRAFIKSTFGAGIALGLATVPFNIAAFVRSEPKTDRQFITTVAALERGKSLEFEYPGKESSLLVHLKNGEFVAYNNKCTHLQCPVFYVEEEDVLLCPCHRGYFGVDGQPQAGPPQRELPKILLEIENGKIFAVGREIHHGA